MSQNFYDASGNFKGSSYMMISPLQQPQVAPFNAISLARDTSQQPLGSSPQQQPQAGTAPDPQSRRFVAQHAYNTNPPQVPKESTEYMRAAADPTTLPPQIGQQQFGGFGAGGGSGLGSLGGGNGQTNVSLNLQGSATMNGGNQNRGYPGMNFASAQDQSRGTMDYAEGGRVDAAPQGLAALGRGNDTQLVHMTPREVHGLQQLALAHGGSLTTNPHTGLLEAGFLERLLPAAAAAMAYPTMGAEGAALVGGAVTTATTNDFRKGIANGMMIYGMGNAAEGIERMGAKENLTGLEASGIKNNALGQSAYDKTFAAEQARQAQSPEMAAYNEQMDKYREESKYDNPPPAPPLFGGTPEVLAQSARTAAAENAPGPSGMSNLQAGFGRFADKPLEAAKDLYKGMNKFGVAGLGAGALTAIDRFSNKPPTTAPAPVATKPFTARYTPKTRFPTEEERKRLGSGEYNYFPTAAAGGSTEDIKRMAQGGIASTLDYAAGGKLLSGAGDGMSDSIPAVIQGSKPQRAALADGEFVIPADVVSHLGNGSTKAGAQHLYTMMDKIRKARTGNPKQGKQINPHKFLTS